MVVVSLLASARAAYAAAAEESLDLDSLSEATPAPAARVATAMQRFSLMGRVDITSETSAPNEDANHQMRNSHFLVFLKVTASPKTSFMGQLISEDPNNIFYYVEHRPMSLFHLQFGKIIVPFGDTRRFHHIYGGVQTLGSPGVLLPNIWSATGLNLNWSLAQNWGQLETYVVNTAVDGNAGTADDPEISQTAENRRQAVGVRYTHSSSSRYTFLISGYQGSYANGLGLDLNLLGVDFFTDYGAWNLDLFKRLRFSVGAAQATFESRPNEGDIRQNGDYLEIATNAVGPGELRARYGTYVDNHKVESVRDTHAAALGYALPVDVMRVLAEYQWNFEAINEQDNDLFRAMVSLDF